MNASPNAATLDRAAIRLEGNPLTSSYTSLSRMVREAGLLNRRRGFYITVFALLVLALAGSGTGFVLLGHSWLQLLIAGVLGVIFTQFAFLAHEASHRQVFTSGKANDVAGRVLGSGFVGVSYNWWMNKHSRHHANPNVVDKDPDIEMDVLSFYEERAAKKKGFFSTLFTRHQGYLFFPLLLVEGLNLHVTSIRSLLDKGTKAHGRGIDLTIVVARLTLYVGVLFWFLPIGMAFAFLGVQLAVFGVYMGMTFAPNHKGMPIIPRGSKIDFLSKQVLTSRNITGGLGMSALMGGLNYQIEHHLFPSMPRPNLSRAREIVKEYCAQHSVPYTETTLARSYGIVVQYLNRVGLSARDPFDCPFVNQYRR